jgi:hypothetical protein
MFTALTYSSEWDVRHAAVAEATRYQSAFWASSATPPSSHEYVLRPSTVLRRNVTPRALAARSTVRTANPTLPSSVFTSRTSTGPSRRILRRYSPHVSSFDCASSISSRCSGVGGYLQAVGPVRRRPAPRDTADATLSPEAVCGGRGARSDARIRLPDAPFVGTIDNSSSLSGGCHEDQ